jgi:hypothetical protein
MEFKRLKISRGVYLDTETYSFEGKNPMSSLGLRTIQYSIIEEPKMPPVSPTYIIWEDLSLDEQDYLRQALINKDIYCFNLNFDASQLAHAGFHVQSNR